MTRAERAMTSRWRNLLASGWIPTLLVAGEAVWLVHYAAHVHVVDVLMFLGYLAGWIVLPGTLAWRLTDRVRHATSRSLSEDVAIGALVGYVLEFPVYMGCLALGEPHLYLGWPILAVALAGAAAKATGYRGLWRLRSPSDTRLSPATSWSMALALAYVVLWFTHNVWSVTPVSGLSLQNPYQDEPYQLSLVASLRHFFPAKVLFVDGAPLKYHYLAHLHLAASSWVTGIEPMVILRALGIPFLFLLVMLAAARVAMRLTGASWTGPALLAGILVAPFNQSAPRNIGFGLLDTHLVVSPSAGFAFAPILLGLLLCIEFLRRTQSGLPAWCLVGLTFVTMLGAKSASLPTLLVGLWVAALATTFLQRRPNRVGLALALVATVAFVAGKQFFFGSSMQGLYFDPFAITDPLIRRYPSLADASGAGVLGVHISLAIGFLVGYLSLGAGVLALLVRAGWRQPDTLFLIFTCAAGLGAGFAFNQQGNSQVWFIYVVMLTLLLGAVLGLHRVLPPMNTKTTAVLVLTATGGALAATAIFRELVTPAPAGRLGGTVFEQLLRVALVPNLALVLIGLAVAMTLTVGWRSSRRPEFTAPFRSVGAALIPILVLSAAGVGLYYPLRQARSAVLTPLQAAKIPRKADTGAHWLIGPQGIQAATWLKRHSRVDDLVATNAHCNYPTDSVARHCRTQNFWMAAYSERQFLVEGWAYVTWVSVSFLSVSNENLTTTPF